jgi:hypothetical protein
VEERYNGKLSYEDHVHAGPAIVTHSTHQNNPTGVNKKYKTAPKLHTRKALHELTTNERTCQLVVNLKKKSKL